MDREIKITNSGETAGVEDRPPEELRGPNGTAMKPEERTQLFTAREGEDLRFRWGMIQTGFVDEPRKSVQEADALVSEVIQCLTGTFTRERAKLEQGWDRGENVSTEDLRIALRRYRSFFDRLLAI
jgi:hypothetical protein